jgi:hypothetical protein
MIPHHQSAPNHPASGGKEHTVITLVGTMQYRYSSNCDIPKEKLELAEIRERITRSCNIHIFIIRIILPSLTDNFPKKEKGVDASSFLLSDLKKRQVQYRQHHHTS